MFFLVKDPGNQFSFDVLKNSSNVMLGHCSSSTWYNDPKRLLFVLSRYKFTAEMLSGSSSCLEIGSGDGFASKLVKQSVDRLDCLDYEEELVDQSKSLYGNSGINFFVHDILSNCLEKRYDSAFSLDVLEHIIPSDEDKFLTNIVSSLTDSGIFLIGMPSLESQKYASDGSKLGHVNCKSKSELKLLMTKYFRRVFMFSMNDEVVHTGFPPMSHYIFALGVIPRSV